MVLEQILKVLNSRRFDLSSEAETQKQIHQALLESTIRHDREVKIGDRDRIDFLCEGGVGIEVKVQGQARKIHRQLCRYADSDEIKTLIVATGRTLGMPSEIKSKPVIVVSLGRGWL